MSSRRLLDLSHQREAPILCGIFARPGRMGVAGIWLLYAWYMCDGEEHRECAGIFDDPEMLSIADRQIKGLPQTKQTFSLYLPHARGFISALLIWTNDKPRA